MTAVAWCKIRIVVNDRSGYFTFLSFLFFMWTTSLGSTVHNAYGRSVFCAQIYRTWANGLSRDRDWRPCSEITITAIEATYFSSVPALSPSNRFVGVSPPLFSEQIPQIHDLQAACQWLGGGSSETAFIEAEHRSCESVVEYFWRIMTPLTTLWSYVPLPGLNRLVM